MTEKRYILTLNTTAEIIDTLHHPVIRLKDEEASAISLTRSNLEELKIEIEKTLAKP